MSERGTPKSHFVDLHKDTLNTGKALQIMPVDLGLPDREDLGAGALTSSQKIKASTFYIATQTTPLVASIKASRVNREYLVRCPSINGGGINALLYYCAPSKGFGFDTSDIVNDWKDIDSQDNVGRNRQHEKMPDWNITKEHIKLFRPAIESWFNFGDRAINIIPETQKDQYTFTPVLHWTKDFFGTRKFMIEGEPRKESDPLLGIYYVASFSYDITKNWPKRLGYNPASNRTQPMGTTQTVHLAVMLRNQLFNGTFMKKLEIEIDKNTSIKK